MGWHIFVISMQFICKQQCIIVLNLGKLGGQLTFTFTCGIVYGISIYDRSLVAALARTLFSYLIVFSRCAIIELYKPISLLPLLYVPTSWPWCQPLRKWPMEHQLMKEKEKKWRLHSTWNICVANWDSLANKRNYRHRIVGSVPATEVVSKPIQNQQKKPVRKNILQ